MFFNIYFFGILNKKSEKAPNKTVANGRVSIEKGDGANVSECKVLTKPDALKKLSSNLNKYGKGGI